MDVVGVKVVRDERGLSDKREIVGLVRDEENSTGGVEVRLRQGIEITGGRL